MYVGMVDISFVFAARTLLDLDHPLFLLGSAPARVTGSAAAEGIAIPLIFSFENSAATKVDCSDQGSVLNSAFIVRENCSSCPSKDGSKGHSSIHH